MMATSRARTVTFLAITTAAVFFTNGCEGFSPEGIICSSSASPSTRMITRTSSYSALNHVTIYHQQRNKQSKTLKLSIDDVDAGFIGGSVLWAMNGYLGIDWLLAPIGVGLDSDFNPATRATTFFGKISSGAPLDEAMKESQVVQDGERPEMGSRVGTGANVGYTVEGLAKMGGDDWLAQRDAGLSASAPPPLQLAVTLLFVVLGVALQSVTHSTTTAGVLVIPAMIYEIGRPSLPTREEALLDVKIDNAVESFVESSVLLYGQEPPQGVAAVKQSEATNERELVTAFRRKMQEKVGDIGDSISNADVSDFQIEMRMRSYGSGRSTGGFIKGIRLRL
ncbi:unnamed protein product [Cylindrotheca closterium]|uniref:Uncharacterized protein n=1 Tax=Cylindrotheca closterium TaxID=2856 RepID=A0AAD2CCD6_9STRA|nr:unnamed protein product [Cylindrotheca closterium]